MRTAALGLILYATSAAACRSRSGVASTDSGSPKDMAATADALASCGGGTVGGSGSTADGPFVPTAITVSGKVCGPTTSVQVAIAGNGSSKPAITFNLMAQALDGGAGIRLPTGTMTVMAGISGRQGTATVNVTSAADAPETPDGGPVSHIEGSFTIVDGTATLTGTFSCPFCAVVPCISSGV